MIIKNESGADVEVFTAAETEARVKEASEKAAQVAVEKATSEFSEKNKGIETEMNTLKEKLLDKLAGTDAEMKKKIEFFYDSFKGDAVSKKDIKSRVENAYILAAGKTPAPGFLDGITGGGARGGQDYNPGGSKKAPTENEIAIGNVLGVTDKDREKFRGKVNSSSKE
jgi:hypothetical protein